MKNEKIDINPANILNKALKMDDYDLSELMETIMAAKVVLIHDYETDMDDTDSNSTMVAKKLVQSINDKVKD